MNLLDFACSEKAGHIVDRLICRKDLIGVDRFFKYADRRDSSIVLRDCKIQTADLDSLVAVKCILNVLNTYGIYVVIDKESRLAFVECYYEDKVLAGVIDVDLLSLIDISGSLSFKRSLEGFICRLQQ